MMDIRLEIRNILKEELNNEWYHGTNDVRDLKKVGNFSDKYIEVTYVTDVDKMDELQALISASHGEDRYFDLLGEVPKLRSTIKVKNPVFLTNNYSVANSYTERASMDYQNSVEKVVKVRCDIGKTVTIEAYGQSFREMSLDIIKRGFESYGISSEEFDLVNRKFNFYQKDKSKVRTNELIAIGDHFGVDYIDITGVLDSYSGGSIKSTVRMVFSVNKIKITNF